MTTDNTLERIVHRLLDIIEQLSATVADLAGHSEGIDAVVTGFDVGKDEEEE